MATQVFGGTGFMEMVAAFYRDAKILEIGEGTSEIRRLVIARHLGLPVNRRASVLRARRQADKSGEVGFEGVDGDGELGRELVAERGVVLADLGDRRPPAAASTTAARRGRRRRCRGRRVERVRSPAAADRRVDRLGLAVDPLEDPLEDAAVLAEAGPQEAAVLVAAEPVDEEDPRQLGRIGVLRRSSASGRSSRPSCSRRTAASPSGRTAGCRRRPLGGRGLRRHDRAEEHAVLPVVGLGHERHRGAAPAAEEDRRDRHAGGVLPLGRDRRTLRGRRREAGVRVRGRRFGLGVPGLPRQSIARAGGVSVMPSHHTSPSSVSAVLV